MLLCKQHVTALRGRFLKTVGKLSGHGDHEPAIAPAPALSIRLLGGLRLGGVSETGPVAREARHHVRAVLALAGSSCSGMGREEIVALLWPKASVAAARNRLHHTVHLARQALAALAWDDDWIAVRNGRVVIDERVWCDVHELERSAQRCNTDLGTDELLRVVRHCANGDWVPELDVGPVGDAVRARIRQFQSVLLREAIVRQTARGDSAAQRELLQGLLRIESTDEWTHRELMRLDFGAGRHHAVLRTFDRLRGELSTQLGLRPSPDTCLIADRAATALRNVPVVGVAESLMGREALVQELVAQLSHAAGVWNVTGLSGIGKTSVVKEVVRRLASSFPLGVHVVDFGDIDTPSSAAAACVRALGLSSTGRESDIELLTSVVRQRPMLLVLDDLDSVAGAAELLAETCSGAMRAKVIVTSRARFALERAVQIALPALPVPEPDASPEQARQCAGFALFEMRCPLVGTELESDAWQRDAVQLVRRLDGLPLAIELAAARTATMTPGEILAQIDRNLRPLADGPVDMDGRHRSLGASLDWSVRLLSAAARSAYAAVSVFPGAFARDDVGSLLPAVGLATDQVNAVLDELTGAGLLALAPQGGRLRLLHLPRAHARAWALEHGLWPALLTARLHAVCQRFDDNPLEFESPSYTQRLLRVLELEDDATALLEHARSSDPARFVRLLVTLCESWGMRGSNSLVLMWSEPTIECARRLAMTDAELWLRFCTSKALSALDDDVKAEQFSATMLPLIERSADPVLCARATATRAAMLNLCGRSREAIETASRGLQRGQAGPAGPGFWTLFARLGMMRAAPSDVSLDIGLLRQRFSGSPLWPILLRGVLSDTGLGVDWHSQLELAGELVECAMQLRSKLLVRIGLTCRAKAQLGLDNTAAALASCEEAYVLMRDAGWRHHAADELIDLAALNWHMAGLGAALAHLDEAVELLGAGEHDALAVNVPLHRAMVFALQGNPGAASSALLSIPVARLAHTSDENLVVWAEAGTVLARLLRHAALAETLASALRRFDADAEVLPVQKRFREQWIGAVAAPRVTDVAALDALREVLCSGVHELRELLVESAARAEAS